MTTNWILTNEHTSFPIMYHWRILPNTPCDSNINDWENIDSYSQYWEQHAIRNRIEQIHNATNTLVLFLEYIPQNLHDWLKQQISIGGETQVTAIQFVEKNLRLTNQYMNTHGLIHFDSHFNNILTDGEQLYYSDFGLALSSQFELTPVETEFLKQHHNYDQACAAVNLLHSILTAIYGKEQWKEQLHRILTEENVRSEIPLTILDVIKRNGATALVMNEFFQKLQHESKQTPYPTDKINRLLQKSEF